MSYIAPFFKFHRDGALRLLTNEDDVNKALDLIASVPILSRLQKRHLRKLRKFLYEVVYSPGSIIIESGSTWPVVGVIAEGTADIFREGNIKGGQTSADPT